MILLLVVALHGFSLDREPVTNAEMRAFVIAHPEWQRGRVPALFADASYLARWAGPTTLGPRAPERAPVVEVSWFAARAFCAARGGRLPTEAEWELAARDDKADDVAWASAPVPDVLPAIGGAPNASGVSDLHGLVWEWIEDFSARSIEPGSCGATNQAIDAREYAKFIRFAFRSSLQAHYTTGSLGFRCAYDQVKR